MILVNHYAIWPPIPKTILIKHWFEIIACPFVLFHNDRFFYVCCLFHQRFSAAYLLKPFLLNVYIYIFAFYICVYIHILAFFLSSLSLTHLILALRLSLVLSFSFSLLSCCLSLYLVLSFPLGISICHARARSFHLPVTPFLCVFFSLFRSLSLSFAIFHFLLYTYIYITKLGSLYEILLAWLLCRQLFGKHLRSAFRAAWYLLLPADHTVRGASASLRPPSSMLQRIHMHVASHWWWPGPLSDRELIDVAFITS